MKKRTTKNQVTKQPIKLGLIYESPDKIVSVVRKASGLGRWPIHSYPCVLLLLRPTEGTRVRVLDDGVIEYMAPFDELKATIKAIDPKLAAKFPITMRNKPLRIKKRWDAFNAKRNRKP